LTAIVIEACSLVFKGPPKNGRPIHDAPTIDQLRAKLPGGKIGANSTTTAFAPGLSLVLLDGTLPPNIHPRGHIVLSLYLVAKAAEDDGFDRLERHKVVRKAQRDGTCLVETLELFQG
jgi:hypothetical protein